MTTHNTTPKTRITLYVDTDLVEYYKELAGDTGSYQRIMNKALRYAMQDSDRLKKAWEGYPLDSQKG
jgi:uncharacterized protein (DUF4415 family)